MLRRRFATLVLVVCALMLVFGTVANAATPAQPSVPRGGAGIAAGPKSPKTVESKASPPEWSTDQIVVKLKPSVASVLGELIDSSAGVASAVDVLDIEPQGFRVVTLKRGVSVEQAIAAYSVQPGVSWAQPDFIYRIDATPNDPSFGELWGLNNTGQSGGTPSADIGAVTAWNTETGDRSASGPIVAVIDSGVDYTHPDLAANMWSNSGEIPANGLDDDGNGYVDDVYGYDFRNHDGDPMDDNGHGTHCSGTIGGVGNNGVGVAGVNWAVRIMALKFFPVSGGGLTSDAILAIDYANDMGADVISNSWSGGDYDAALKAVIDVSEAVIVFAAGNHSSDIDAFPHYPGSYDSAQIVTVAATDRNDQLADFSNVGATSVDVGAPGVDILSTWPTALIPSGYFVASGTSMATPHVAGLAALIMANNPALDHVAVKQLILQTAEPLPALSGKCATGARIDAAAALAVAASPPAPSSITGSVVDTDTGLPLARVIVRVHPASSEGLWRSYETTIDGTYQASDLPAGEYKVGFAPGGVTQQYWQDSTMWAGATTVTVAAGGTVADVDAGLTVSNIKGTVTAETSGLPVEHIESWAYRHHSGTWEWVSTAYSAATGSYSHVGLVPGDYRVDFYDDSGVYLYEYYDGVTDPSLATTVTVGAEQTRIGIDASLRKAIHIKGKVTAEASGLPLKNIECSARRFDSGSGTWEWASTVYSGADGMYDHAGVVAGGYRLDFYDGSGTYLSEYYNGVTDPSLATTVTVIAEETKSGIDASLLKTPQNAAHITGKVTAQMGGAAISDVTVWTYRHNSNSGVWELKNSDYSESSGAYDVGGLPAGYYRAEFYDSSGRYLSEFYDGVTDFSLATTVTVGDSETKTGIDASLLDTAGSCTVKFVTDGTVGAFTSEAMQIVVSGGDSDPVTATAPASHDFVNWTGTGSFETTTANPLTVSNVTADATITAHFAIKTFEIVPTAGANGTITPSTTQTVDYGADKTFTFTPDTGYHVATLTVDASAVATTATSYTFSNVREGHTIGVTFAADAPATTYTLNYTAGTGGSIDGSATQVVAEGSDGATVTAVPDTGYTFVKWSDDSTSAVRRDTAVTANLDVTATFEAVAPTTFEIVPTAGAHGTITPATTQTVDAGDNATFTFTPDTGYHVATLTVDAVSQATTQTSYTFTAVAADHTIDVTFAKDDAVLMPVWRFRNKKLAATYLWTASDAERTNIEATMGDTWVNEGVAFEINTANPLNKDPLWRFLKTTTWTYFFTATEAEKNNTIANLSSMWGYEGAAFSISLTPQAETIWRFRNASTNTFLFTGDVEKALVLANNPEFALEGPAFWIAP